MYVMLFMDVGVFFAGSSEAWLLLLFAITMSGIVSNTLYYRGLAKLKAEQTAPLFYLDPMTGTLLATLLLGEQLQLIAALGVVVVVAGVFVSYPHHHHVLHNYVSPRPHRVKRLLERVFHPYR